MEYIWHTPKYNLSHRSIYFRFVQNFSFLNNTLFKSWPFIPILYQIQSFLEQFIYSHLDMTSSYPNRSYINSHSNITPLYLNGNCYSHSIWYLSLTLLISYQYLRNTIQWGTTWLIVHITIIIQSYWSDSLISISLIASI